MRPNRLLPLTLLSLLIASTVHAQYGGFDRGYGRRHEPTHADSLHTLEGPWQMWGHLGFGWIGMPSDIRTRYHAGLDLGLTGDRRFASRVALRAAVAYHDFPSNQPNVVFIDGIAYPVNQEYGHGWLTSALGGVAVCPWNHLWLEGGAGGAYFHSGFGSTLYVVDPATGQTLTISGGSGGGPAFSAGVRYEFKPTLRDRVLGEVQFLSMDREGTRLQFWAVRIGYRFF